MAHRLARSVGLATLVFIAPFPLQAASLDDTVAALCSSRTSPGSGLDFDTVLAADPPAALALACARWRGAPAERRARAAVDLALAQARIDESPETPALVTMLRLDSAVQADPVLVVELELAARIQAYGAGQYSRAAQALDALRRDLGSAIRGPAAAPPRARLEFALLEARLQRRLRPDGWVEAAERSLDAAEVLLPALGAARLAWTSEVYNARTMQADARHDLPAALRWAERELAVAVEAGLGNSLSLIDTYNNIASFQDQLHHLDDAERTWRRALDLVERNPQAGAQVRSGAHANYAVHLSNRGHWAEALEEARRADAIGIEVWGERSPRRVEALTRMAEDAWNLGRLRDAIQTIELALELAAAAPRDVGAQRMMRLHEIHADVLASLGRGDDAGKALAEGLAEDPRGEQRYRRARAQWKRGALFATQRRWHDAETALAEAEPALEALVGAGHPWLSQLTAQRCIVQLRLEPARDEACGRLQRAPARPDEIPYHRAQRLAALAEAAGARGDAEQERDLRLSALAAAQHVQGPQPLWSAYAALAQLLRREGRHQIATLLGKRAVQALQELRHDAAAEALGLEQDFMADKREVYERLADWLTADGRLAEALAVLDLLKEHELHEFTRGQPLALDAPAAPALPWTPAEERELPRWSAASSERVPAREPARREITTLDRDRETARRLLQDEAQRVAAWQRGLATAPRVAAAEAPATPPDRPEVAAGEMHLHAYRVGRSMNLVFDSAGGRRLERRAIDPDELDRRIGQWLSAIAAHRGDDELAAYFGALLARPVAAAAQAVGARRLVLHLSGNLRYLPWAALDTGRGPLGTRLAIAHAAWGHADRPLQAATVRVLATTRAVAGQPRLAALAQEVCAIVDGPARGWAEDDARCAGRGALRGEAWLNAAFTRERLAQSATAPREQVDVLHLASHFTLRPGLMSASWLLLGDGSRLSLGELAALDFDGQDLVTLSACETGIGGDGAEVEGLNRVILRRGAERVLASLWRVDDRSTSALMAAFYRALAAGIAPPEALAAAQAAVRADPRWADPFHWAGFYLTG